MSVEYIPIEGGQKGGIERKMENVFGQFFPRLAISKAVLMQVSFTVRYRAFSGIKILYFFGAAGINVLLNVTNCLLCYRAFNSG